MLVTDVAEIVATRTKCLFIHHAKDIDVAGDEVEGISLLYSFRSHLPCFLAKCRDRMAVSHIRFSPINSNK